MGVTTESSPIETRHKVQISEGRCDALCEFVDNLRMYRGIQQAIIERTGLEGTFANWLQYEMDQAPYEALKFIHMDLANGSKVEIFLRYGSDRESREYIVRPSGGSERDMNAKTLELILGVVYGRINYENGLARGEDAEIARRAANEQGLLLEVVRKSLRQ